MLVLYYRPSLSRPWSPIVAYVSPPPYDDVLTIILNHGKRIGQYTLLPSNIHSSDVWDLRNVRSSFRERSLIPVTRAKAFYTHEFKRIIHNKKKQWIKSNPKQLRLPNVLPR